MLDAIEFAVRKHAGQVRKWGGEPYVLHCVRVAKMVQESGMPEEAVRAAILHDVLEDTETTEEELRERFGVEVTRLVVALTDSPKEVGNREARKVMDRKRIIEAGVLAQGIKFADIADNLPSILEHDPKFGEIMKDEVLLFLGGTPSYLPGNPYKAQVNWLYDKAYKATLGPTPQEG